MSKYIAIYEQLFPTDPISKSDPRRPEIIAEMKAIHRAKTDKEAAAVIDWWPWDSPGDCMRCVKRARRMMAK
ncbi:MAG: hypothetical protein NUV75_02180 [Gallionella sp.]|nr:hypothetical protein [Gallionella sp.]